MKKLKTKPVEITDGMFFLLHVKEFDLKLILFFLRNAKQLNQQEEFETRPRRFFGIRWGNQHFYTKASDQYPHFLQKRESTIYF